MKKAYVLTLVLILLASILLLRSLSQPKFELIESQIEITKDSDVTGTIVVTEGEDIGKQLTPTALHYRLILENQAILGQLHKEDFVNLDYYIEAHAELKQVATNTVGFNVFDPSAYISSGVRHGSSLTIEDNRNRMHIDLRYDLGVDEPTDYVNLKAPSEDQQENLLKHAAKSYLVLTIDGEEFGRFSIENHQSLDTVPEGNDEK
ncbi:MAG TPA: hypothetical protein DHN33_05065 [Eubacteriaceae bacterium]|nr:hypothetical protein [Eubacteriaceae bacterium]